MQDDPQGQDQRQPFAFRRLEPPSDSRVQYDGHRQPADKSERRTCNPRPREIAAERRDEVRYGRHPDNLIVGERRGRDCVAEAEYYAADHNVECRSRTRLRSLAASNTLSAAIATGATRPLAAEKSAHTLQAQPRNHAPLPARYLVASHSDSIEKRRRSRTRTGSQSACSPRQTAVQTRPPLTRRGDRATSGLRQSRTSTRQALRSAYV